MTLTLLGPLVALFLVLTRPAGSGHQAANDTTSRTIPVYVSEKRALMMLRVGDHFPVPVVFDTGTNGNLVDIEFAKAIGLPENGPSPSIDGSTGKPVAGFDTFVKNARLGGVPVPDARATAFAYSVTDEVGIFGPNSFPNKLVTLDLARGRLVIQDKSAANLPKGEAFPYNSRHLPAIPIDLGGVRVEALLDTGNDVPILLPLSIATKLRLDKPLAKVGTTTSAAGTQPVYAARLKGKLHVANVEVAGPRLLFIEGGTANVGLSLIRQLRVVIDPTEERTWILPASSPKK